MKKLILFFSILTLVTLSLVIFIHLEGVKISYGCRSFIVDNACMVQKVEKSIDSEPEKATKILIQIASLRRLSLLGGDFRIYSSSLHRLGQVFFLKGYSFDNIGDLCPALIKDGCIHGYVMEFINKEDVDKGISLCNSAPDTRVRLGCIHALGHSYLEFNDQSVGQANTSFCKNYSDLEYVSCLSGLFHEDSKAGSGKGHKNYYQRPHEYNDISCDNFADKEYAICYGAKGSFRQYFPESESIQSTYRICEAAKTEEAKKSCKYSALQRLDIARGYSFVNGVTN